MSFSTLQRYTLIILTHVPWPHWVVMGLLSLALTIILLFQKRHSFYGAICLGISAFIGLFLLDAAVLSRLSGTAPPKNGFSLSMEYNRLIHGGAVRWTEMLANVLVFVPFGLFLTEFLASGKKFSAGPRQGLATLFGFVLSLCIESFQLVLRVGVFELTDLVMNTLGTFVGTGVAVVLRRFLLSLALGRNDNKEISSLR